MAMTNDQLREWLEDKRLRSVKQVRVTSVEEALAGTVAEGFPDAADDLRAARDEAETIRTSRRARGPKVGGDLGDQLRANASLRPVTYEIDGKDPVEVKGMLVGTKEVAAILGVETPRIGRWQSLGDMMPEPIANTAAGPIWFRPEIEAYIPIVEARRKTKR